MGTYGENFSRLIGSLYQFPVWSVPRIPESGRIGEYPNPFKGETPVDSPVPDGSEDLGKSGKTIEENPVKVGHLDAPVKSENDKKDYR